jgi:hypothetical protein
LFGANGTGSLCVAGVGTDRTIGGEIPIALDEESKRPAQRREFRETHVAKLGTAEAQVTQAKGDVGVSRVQLGE